MRRKEAEEENVDKDEVGEREVSGKVKPHTARQNKERIKT